MSNQIHSTAIIEEGALIGENVFIGPYCVIGKDVKIGNNNTLKSHVVIEGNTSIGNDNTFYQFCAIGLPPQDKTYKDEPTKTIIGDDNLFREGCTIHRATTKQNLETKIGNHGYFMSTVHIAHDCKIGDYVTLASGVACAGHVTLGNYVQMGGQCGVTPFVTLGNGAFIGGASAVDKDIPHYCTAYGNRIRLKGVNIIGLKRRGHDKQEISEFVEFYRTMEISTFSPRAFVLNDENLSEYKNNRIVKDFAEFIAASEIGPPPFMS